MPNVFACPACGSTAFKPFCQSCFLGVDEREIRECSRCGLSALLPQPTAAELNEYYGGSYFGWDLAKEDGKSWYFARHFLAGRPKGRFLDIGCATGIFLKGIEKYSGWQAYGNEFSPQAVAFGRKHYGLDIRAGELKAARFKPAFFDFIHMNNVLEHVRDPFGLLKECARILKPGGRLLIVTPNGGTDRQAYADFCRYIQGTVGSSRDGHLYFYSPASLHKLFERSGLRLTQAYSAGWMRALRSLGILPRTPSWFKGYVPRRRRKVDVKVEDTIQAGKPRPKLYHWYKHWKERVTRLPGFWKLSYDYHLELTKD
jgi:SAM-dependent methyltransferase